MSSVFKKPKFGPAPSNYVAGLGRGATGFTTRSDIGPARNLGAGESGGQGSGAGGGGQGNEEVDRGDYSETKFDDWGGYEGSLFAKEADMDDEDREAERAYDNVDGYMDGRRSAQREQRLKEELLKIREERPIIGQQFSDLKRDLGGLSHDEWDSIPDIGDYTIKKQKRPERFTPVPDSIIEGARNEISTNNSLEASSGLESVSGVATVTNLNDIGEAREAALGIKLDKASDSVSGQTVVDPKGYLTSLSTLDVSKDADIGDIKKARLLLKSVTTTNPKDAPGWIAAARLEELDGKLQQARKLVAQGLQHCQKSEDLWLEVARLQPPEKAKTVLAKALILLPISVKLWLAASAREAEKSNKLRVLHRALEKVPNSVRLWKEAIALEEEENAKELLYKAVECVPSAVEFWLALAKLENYDKARTVLNSARRALPNEALIWINAAKLEEAQGHAARVETMITKGIGTLTNHGVAINQEFWLKEAENAEFSDNKLTCVGIVKAILPLTPESEDREAIWQEYAEMGLSHGAVQTSRAIYAFALTVFPHEENVWLKAIELEKTQNDQEKLHAILEEAVQKCPEFEIFWLMSAKEKWMSGNIQGSRETLNEAFSVHQGSENIFLAAVKLERMNNEIERARRLLTKAREDCSSGRIWMQSAQLEREQGNIEQAFEFAKEGVKKCMRFEKLWLIAAQLSEQLGDKPGAKQFYRDGTVACKRSVNLWVASARFEMKLGNYTKARPLLERARITIPKNDLLYLEGIRLEVADGNQKAAIALLAKGLQEIPESGVLWAEAIHLEPRASRRAKAVDAMKRCNDNPQVILAVARIFWKDRKIEKARKWFDRASMLNPDWGDTWAFYYKFELELGTDQQQLDVERRCIEADPKHGEYWAPFAKEVHRWRWTPEQKLKNIIQELE